MLSDFAQLLETTIEEFVYAFAPIFNPKICANNHARLILPFRGKSTLFATLNMQENEIDEIEIT